MSRGLLVAVGLMLVFGATAVARTGEQAARPRTLAEVRGSVIALGQDGPRIAWIKRPRGRPLQILTLPGRHPVDVGFVPLPEPNCVCQPMAALAVSADGRVVWQELTTWGNTYLAISLRTDARRAPRTRFPGSTVMDIEDGNPDWVDPTPRGLPAAADGKAILFYADCESIDCGSRQEPAIYRLAGRRSKRLARANWPLALAVSGRRFAAVTNSLRCCNFTPVWSHDGKRLAWVYHGNLWTIRSDGTGDRQLAAGVSPSELEDDARRPSWSPDDARLVFERTEWNDGHLQSRGVYRVDATGGGLRRLASGMAPAWSPDGTRIAFGRGGRVFSIKPDGTGATRLTAAARATEGQPSWSPDSTRIAVSRGGDIYSVRADGTGEARLTTSRRREAQQAWSPDGTRIAYVDGSSIAVVNADGSAAKRVTRGNDDNRSPAWSPDSKRVAFVRGSEVWVMNADGSGPRRLMPGNEFHYSPQWAPAGSAIAVADWYQDPGGYPRRPGIRLVSPVDGKARKIAPVPHSPVQIRDALTGRLIKRFTIDGHAHSIALGPDYVALLVDHEPGVRVELYDLNGRFRKAAAVPPSVRNLSAAGRTVVFASGRMIRRLDAERRRRDARDRAEDARRAHDRGSSDRVGRERQRQWPDRWFDATAVDQGPLGRDRLRQIKHRPEPYKTGVQVDRGPGCAQRRSAAVVARWVPLGNAMHLNEREVASNLDE
jgi:WD40-like Beta Propeller Repeat